MRGRTLSALGMSLPFLLGGCVSEDRPSGETSGETSAPTGATTQGSTSSDGGGTDSTSSGAPTGTTMADTSGGATCPMVDGSYIIGFDPGQPSDCNAALSPTNTCVITQEACVIKWFCNGPLEDYLPQGPIDASGVFMGEGVFNGAPMVCVITFDDAGSFEWECTSGDLVCTGGGF